MTTGEKLLHYTIQNLTEENQFFRSFTAKHTYFDKHVTIRGFKNFVNEQEKQTFLTEIRKLAQIQHPNILTLYDLIETEKEIYLVFETAEGKTLAEYIQKVTGPIPEEKTKKLFLKIVDAFQLAHQYGIYNGAIHPQYIIITPEEDIKILDLALSPIFLRFLRNQDKEALAYLSPEQIKDEPTDKRSDIYALGVILFQMLTGKNIYKGLPITEMKTKIITEALPDARLFYPMISDGIQHIIQKATEKTPAKRYSSCEELKAALQALDQENPLPQPSSPPWEEEYAKAPFVNVPLYFLIIVATITLLMLWRFNSHQQHYSELISNLQDTLSIKSKKDSIYKAKTKKNIEDSLRILSRLNPKDSAKLHYHRVKAGENLQSIASKYFMPLEELKKINELTGNETLSPRLALKVWIKTKHNYKVGEALADIALKYKVPDYAIRRTNDIANEADLKDGKELIIPFVR